MRDNKGRFIKGSKTPDEWKRKRRDRMTGDKNPCKRPEIRRKLSQMFSGDSSHFWKGGISKENHRIRQTVEYKLWRESVFKRDDYTCVFCLEKGGKLQADHIKPFAQYPELRFAIDNGRTLCEECHKTTDTYAQNLK